MGKQPALLCIKKNKIHLQAQPKLINDHILSCSLNKGQCSFKMTEEHLPLKNEVKILRADAITALFDLSPVANSHRYQCL